MSDNDEFAELRARDSARLERYAGAIFGGYSYESANRVCDLADEEIRRSHDQLFGRYAAKIADVERLCDEATRENARLRAQLRHCDDDRLRWVNNAYASADHVDRLRDTIEKIRAAATKARDSGGNAWDVEDLISAALEETA